VTVRLARVLFCSALSAALIAQTRNESLLRPPPAQAVAYWSSAAATAARTAVVRVMVEVDNGRNKFPIERPSSGVLVATSGIVVTWWDLVREAENAKDKRILVQIDGENQALPASVLARDEATQLALLQIELPPGKVTPSVRLAPGTPLPGSPALVLARTDKDLIAFGGVTSAAHGPTTVRSKPLAAADLLLTDARIDDRCHGGALLGEGGVLLGLCNSEHVHKEVSEPTLEDLKATNYGFAIGTERIRAALAKQLSVGNNLPGAPSPTATAVATAADAVVTVQAGDGAPIQLDDDPYAQKRQKGLGSGVVLSSTGLVVTNHHVLAGKSAAKVTLGDGRSFAAKVVQQDQGNNLALLQCELPAGQKLPAARCGSGDAEPGALLLAIGRPTGKAVSVSIGVLSARRDGGRLQADANLGNHNAGGALVDAAGELIGITDGGRTDMVDRMFAMQGDRAKTETNLAFGTGIAQIRTTFAKALAQAAADDSIRAPIASGAADRNARAGAYAAAVRTAGPAMLNVYVDKSRKPVADETENPFAQAQAVDMQGESLGSGVIIDASGLAISNWHVVDSATEPDGSMRPDHAVRARSFDGKTYEVQVLAISREDDLSLLQLKLASGETAKPVVLGNSEELQPGDGVLAIGNPLGLANTVTAGICTAKNQGIRVKGRWAKLENLIETDAAINGGNSGGALLDLQGRLVGINSAGSSGLSSRGYAIPVDHVRKQILSLLLSAEKLRSPSLGMSVTDTERGVAVAAVVPGSPADRAKIQTGDLLRSLAGTAIAWSPGYALALRGVTPDQPLKLGLERGGKPVEVTAEPLSAAQWAVVRQSSLELEVLSIATDQKLVQEAAIGLHRKFTGDATGSPAILPDQLLRVRRVLPRIGKAPDDVQPGDVLLAAELEQATAAGEAATLRRFAEVSEVQSLFNDRERGSYDGVKFRCWIYRGGKVITTDVTAQRLLP
jgi:S1-C subfamily serine protease